MPIYDFKCPVCGTVQEKLVKSTELTTQICPNDNTPMERQYTVDTLMFRFNYIVDED